MRPSRAAGESPADAVIPERFENAMRPFITAALGQVEELRRAAGETSEQVTAAKTYFAEEAKASADESLSRWNTFFGQLEAAKRNLEADVAKQIKLQQRSRQKEILDERLRAH